MAEPAHAILSEEFQEHLQGRSLVSAVFLTYQFDPAFFEQEILPVFIDLSGSHIPAIRLVQLEEAIQQLSGHLAVYYDAGALIAGGPGSAKLDVRRIPVRHGTGVFHPKNVLALVEAKEPDEDGHKPRALVAAALSANLTRAGWWENLEVCHCVEIAEGEKTRLRDDLIGFLDRLRNKAEPSTDQRAVGDILEFLRGTEQRTQRSHDDRLHVHFYDGVGTVTDFLDQVAGQWLRGTYLEIISPFYDDAPDCIPLRQLLDRFQPKETRVFLRKTAAGEATCCQELYEAVRGIDAVSWGRLSLPKDRLRLGRAEDAAERFVHAKVYRFFTQNPKREFYFVGSPNLTTAAHRAVGNVETGFFVDVVPDRKPDFWLAVEERRPTHFVPEMAEDSTSSSDMVPLTMRHDWGRHVTQAFWDAKTASPELLLKSARGLEISTVGPLDPGRWSSLGKPFADALEPLLQESSLLEVHRQGEQRTLVLVQEEGMSHKPSLLLQLSVADILHYWSLLTPDQRFAFLEARAPEVALLSGGTDLVTRARMFLKQDTLFDRLAGFFHAFGCLERAARDALESNNENAAIYRLFGKKYDSLGRLLGRVVEEQDTQDLVDRYVIVLCARQLCREMSRDYPDFWREHRDDVRELEDLLAQTSTIRDRLVNTSTGATPQFLDWFDEWFLRRAKPLEVEP